MKTCLEEQDLNLIQVPLLLINWRIITHCKELRQHIAVPGTSLMSGSVSNR